MTNKYMKRPTSLAIKEIQMKTTLKFSLSPIKMAMIKKKQTNKYWQGH
jgi:hypothetical protein